MSQAFLVEKPSLLARPLCRLTALGLTFNNLMTRVTLMTAFIMVLPAILALANGANGFYQKGEGGYAFNVSLTISE